MHGHDLGLGLIWILSSGDKPLSEALQVMNNEGISSLVVVDNHFNVVGNISTTDVKVRKIYIAHNFPMTDLTNLCSF